MGVGGRPPPNGREKRKTRRARTVSSLKSSTQMACSILHAITFQSAKGTLISHTLSKAGELLIT